MNQINHPQLPFGTQTPKFCLPKLDSQLAPPFNDSESAHRIASSIARQALEVLNGYRAANSLNKFVNQDQCSKLARRAKKVGDYRELNNIKVLPRVSNGNVKISQISDRILEINTTVRDSFKPRFVVMRWENKAHTGWKVTFLEIG